eukprot:403375682
MGLLFLSSTMAFSMMPTTENYPGIDCSATKSSESCNTGIYNQPTCCAQVNHTSRMSNGTDVAKTVTSYQCLPFLELVNNVPQIEININGYNSTYTYQCLGAVIMIAENTCENDKSCQSIFQDTCCAHRYATYVKDGMWPAGKQLPGLCVNQKLANTSYSISNINQDTPMIINYRYCDQSNFPNLTSDSFIKKTGAWVQIGMIITIMFTSMI